MRSSLNSALAMSHEFRYNVFLILFLHKFRNISLPIFLMGGIILQEVLKLS